MTDLTGGCACGQVRFTAKGDPKFAFFCQCRSCQHDTGSGHSTQFCHDAAAFSHTGDVVAHIRTTDSGSKVTKYFCPACGCPVWGTTSRAETIVMVMAGALDDPAAITPDRIFFHDEAQPWDTASVPEK